MVSAAAFRSSLEDVGITILMHGCRAQWLLVRYY